METIKQLDSAEKDKLEIMLKEIFEELEKANQVNADIVNAVNAVRDKVNNFEETLKDYQPLVPEPNIKPIQQIVQRGIEETKLITEAAQKRIRSDHWRIFLESDTKKWIVILLVSLAFFTYLYLFCVHYVDHR
jgi:hypothetical protein